MVAGQMDGHKIYINFVGHKSTFRISLNNKIFIDGIKVCPLVLFVQLFLWGAWWM